MTVLTPDQVATLVKAMEDDELAPLYYLAIATGARRGELCALRWSDVDWQRPAITINRTAEIVDGAVRFNEPKTDRSRRTIPLPAEAAAILRRHRAVQLEKRLLAGGRYQDQDLVFARGDGSPINPGHVSQHFAVLLRRAGLPRVRLHDLRHTTRPCSWRPA